MRDSPNLNNSTPSSYYLTVRNLLDTAGISDSSVGEGYP